MATLADLGKIPVPAARPRAVEFDPEALYVALDRRRRELRISRRELLRQCGLPTPSIITRLGQGHGLDSRSLVALLDWLGETDLKPYIRPAHLSEEETTHG